MSLSMFVGHIYKVLLQVKVLQECLSAAHNCALVDITDAWLYCRWFKHEVNKVFYQQYTAVEQVRMLAETSVLVTNVGSRSFRMAFLPPGAKVWAPDKDDHHVEHHQMLHC